METKQKFSIVIICVLSVLLIICTTTLLDIVNRYEETDYQHEDSLIINRLHSMDIVSSNIFPVHDQIATITNLGYESTLYDYKTGELISKDCWLIKVDNNILGVTYYTYDGWELNPIENYGWLLEPQD